MDHFEDHLRKYEPFFDGWNLGREVGRGTFSRVYNITRQRGGRTVHAILKVISIPQTQKEAEQRLTQCRGDIQAYRAGLDAIYRYTLREIEIMNKLHISNHVVFFDQSEVHERRDTYGWDILIRMEKLVRLDHWLNADPRRRNPDMVFRIWNDLYEALKACESLHLVHMDIKPENIYYSPLDDSFKLGDFGEAQYVDSEGLAARGDRVGSPAYMPPEVNSRQYANYSSDIYSLALVMYQALNDGKLPFSQKAGALTEEEYRIINERRWRGDPIPKIKKVDKSLMSHLLRCLEHEPSRRFSSAAQAQDQLKQIWLDRHGLARTKKWFILGTAIVALSGGIAVYGLNQNNGRSGDSAPAADTPTPLVTSQVLTPPPTAAPIENIQLFVNGSPAKAAQIYRFNSDAGFTISWSAEGLVDAYSFQLTDQDGFEHINVEGGDTHFNIAPDLLSPNTYRARVGIQPAYGTADDTLWRQLMIVIESPQSASSASVIISTPTPSPTPTETPTAEPTSTPTNEPTQMPTSAPTEAVTQAPTAQAKASVTFSNWTPVQTEEGSFITARIQGFDSSRMVLTAAIDGNIVDYRIEAGEDGDPTEVWVPVSHDLSADTTHAFAITASGQSVEGGMSSLESEFHWDYGEGGVQQIYPGDRQSPSAIAITDSAFIVNDRYASAEHPLILKGTSDRYAPLTAQLHSATGDNMWEMEDTCWADKDGYWEIDIPKDHLSNGSAYYIRVAYRDHPEISVKTPSFEVMAGIESLTVEGQPYTSDDTITGRSKADCEIALSHSGEVIGRTTTDAEGLFTLSLGKTLGELGISGGDTLELTAMDLAQNTLAIEFTVQDVDRAVLSFNVPAALHYDLSERSFRVPAADQIDLSLSGSPGEAFILETLDDSETVINSEELRLSENGIYSTSIFADDTPTRLRAAYKAMKGLVSACTIVPDADKPLIIMDENGGFRGSTSISCDRLSVFTAEGEDLNLHTSVQNSEFDLSNLNLEPERTYQLQLFNGDTRIGSSRVTMPRRAFEAIHAEILNATLEDGRVFAPEGQLRLQIKGEAGKAVNIDLNGRTVTDVTLPADELYIPVKDGDAPRYTLSYAEKGVGANSLDLPVPVIETAEDWRLALQSTDAIAPGLHSLSGIAYGIPTGSRVVANVEGKVVSEATIDERGQFETGEINFVSGTVCTLYAEVLGEPYASLDLPVYAIADPSLNYMQLNGVALLDAQGQLKLNVSGEPDQMIDLTVDGESALPVLLDGDGQASVLLPMERDGIHELRLSYKGASSARVERIKTNREAQTLEIPAIAQGLKVLSGRTMPQMTVNLYAEGSTQPLLTAQADAEGRFTLPEFDYRTENSYTLSGNYGDITACQCPLNVVESAALTLTQVEGLKNGVFTGHHDLVLKGRGLPGKSCELSITGVDIGTAELDPEGQWSLAVSPEKLLEVFEKYNNGIMFITGGYAGEPERGVVGSFNYDAVCTLKVDDVYEDSVAITGKTDAGAVVTLYYGDTVTRANADQQGAFSFPIRAGTIHQTQTLTLSATDSRGNVSQSVVIEVKPVTREPIRLSLAGGSHIRQSYSDVLFLRVQAQTGKSVSVSSGSWQKTVGIVSDAGTCLTIRRQDLGANGELYFNARYVDGLGEGVEYVDVYNPPEDQAEYDMSDQTGDELALYAIDGAKDGVYSGQSDLVLRGSGLANHICAIYIGGLSVGNANISMDGRWSLPLTSGVLANLRQQIGNNEMIITGSYAGEGQSATLGQLRYDNNCELTMNEVYEMDSALNGTTEPNATVLLLQNGRPIDFVVTGESGQFSFSVKSGYIPEDLSVIAEDPYDNISLARMIDIKPGRRPTVTIITPSR